MVLGGVYFDSIDPLCTLMGGQGPPFAADRGICAVCLCGYGLPEYSCSGEAKPRKPIDEHRGGGHTHRVYFDTRFIWSTEDGSIAPVGIHRGHR